MNFEENFSFYWNQIPKLKIPEPDEDETMCIYARSFQKWVDKLASMLENPTDIGVNQAKLILADKYFDWERLVPKLHRFRINPNGHTCIYQVFRNAYERLRVLELSITPPKIIYPPREIPPPKPIIGGLFIGEGPENE